MKIKKIQIDRLLVQLGLLGLLLSNSGCLMTYLVKSGYGQMQILSQRTPIDEVIASNSVDERVKRKLQLVQSVRQFAKNDLGLNTDKNYGTYVDLKRPYVSYILIAAEKYKLVSHLWKYPVVGSLPYMGYFDKEEALQAEEKMDSEKYDTFVRGVTAFSTLGWFEDPILSTMMSYDDDDLVDLIIHESTHATVFLKSQGDFNERLATFVAEVGTQKYYQAQSGDQSKIFKFLADKKSDAELFSKFITFQTEQLKKWYESQPLETVMSEKSKRLEEIKGTYEKDILPQLKTDRYKYFASRPLNNAVLLSYGTYYANMQIFKKLYDFFNKDLGLMLKYCKSLESSQDPEADARKMLESQII